MKIFSKRKKDIVRQAVLAGLIGLTGATSALAQAPEAPTLDWVNANQQFINDDASVMVDVGWSRFDFDEILSVQYRLDGKPVMSRAVNADETYGDAILTIEDEGDFDLSVALCNVDGCTDSETMTISISDENGVEVSVKEVEVGRDTSITSVTPDGMPEVMFTPDLSNLSQQQSSLSYLLATEFGKAVFAGVVRGGADFGTRQILKQIGLGDVDMQTQFDQLHASIADMSQKIADLTNAIEKLEAELLWENFTSEHVAANAWVTPIYSQFAIVNEYILNGLPEEELDELITARDIVSESISKLAGASLLNGGGMLDMTDGLIYKLMRAEKQKIASVESYWPIIEEYREYYRTALAIGVMTLETIAQELDDSVSSRVKADEAKQASQFSVLNMYAYGIAPELPVHGNETIDFVQLRSDTTGYAHDFYALYDESATKRVAGHTYMNVLKNFISEYEPDYHGGLTVQQFLEASGLPTMYFVSTNEGWERSGWQVTKVKHGNPVTATPHTWKVLPRVAEIRGNEWKEYYSTFCPANSHLCNGYRYDTVATWYDGGSSNAQDIRNVIEARKNAARAQGFAVIGNTSAARKARTHYAEIDLSDRLNHAGRVAEMDEDLVKLAAFGDGSAQLWPGMLPDSEGYGECIDLPEETQYLMEVDDFNLRWHPGGNITLRDADNKIVWKSDTKDNADELCFHEDGNLAIYKGSQVTWETGTSDDELGGLGGRVLKLHQDGALQIENELGDIIWWEGTME